MYQHVNHGTMVTILEEARVPFLTEPFANDFDTIGLLIAILQISQIAHVGASGNHTIAVGPGFTDVSPH